MVTRPEQIERTKLSRKVLYHFAIFVINEILMFKDSRIRMSARPVLSKVWPIERKARGS